MRPRIFLRPVLWTLAALSVGAMTETAGAAEGRATENAPSPREVSAPTGKGQLALTVQVTDAGRVRARACAKSPCSLGSTDDLTIDVAAELATLGGGREPKVEVVDVGAGRHVVHVRWGDEPSYHVVLAAPLTARGGKAPVLVHRGFSDRLEGLEGERTTSHVEFAGGGGAGAARQLVVGELRENLSLCGRPALVAPMVLDPATLGLKPARLQRLSARERKAAVSVVAQPVPEAAPGALSLTAVAASSAVGRPSHVSDGDLETTWAEGGGGGGRGEFIVLRAPAGLAITGFEIVARPPSGGSAHATEPRSFWLAGDKELVRVEVPERPEPGGRLRIDLPKPWRTSCVAWVAEEAYGTGPELEVTLAELVAIPEGGDATTQELISWVLEDGERARSAVALLAARPEEAASALPAALSSASDRARRHLLDVADRLTCDGGARTYAAALAVGGPELAERAGRDLERCAAQAPQALLDALEGADPSAEARLAQALAPLAPALAVERLTPRLDTPSAARRFGLRKALYEASMRPEARDALRRALADEKLSERARVDLLRALGPGVRTLRAESAAALERLLARPSFRTRYLLIGPAAELAPEDARARAFLARALRSDESAVVRTAAAATLGAALRSSAESSEKRRAALLAAFEGDLIGALTDDNVRVREAAASALGAGKSERAGRELLGLLDRDAWPLVRQGAVAALGELGANAEVDAALARRLERDDSSQVRAATARALGRRGAQGVAQALERAFRNKEETVEVRVEAARALGAVCAVGASPALTDVALRLTDARLEADHRRIAVAALRALGELRPEGLRERLAPLLGSGAPKQVRALAAEAVASPRAGRHVCGAGRLPRNKP